MQQQSSNLGVGFYEERLARARALPEAERSFDERQWLRQHEELEAALAALPEVPASATAQHPLVEPLGGDAALAVLLRLRLAATYSEFPCDTDHLAVKLWCLNSQLPPFFRVWWHPGDRVGAAGGRLTGRALLACPACRHAHASWNQGPRTFPASSR